MNTTGIKFVDDLDLEGKKVFIRCDFNVPLDDKGNITDDARILAALPTIKRVLNEGALVILASHLGRPKGKVNPKLSLQPVGARLAELLKKEVILPEEIVDPHNHTLIEHLRPAAQIILLENLRFHPGEKSNDPDFAKALASMADMYINDAFGTAHRAHASTYGMVQHFGGPRLKKAGGFLIRNEIEQLGGLLKKPKKPFYAIMGGAKVSDKLSILYSLVERVQGVIIGGAMAYTFLKAQGKDIGNSMVEDDLVSKAREILQRATARGVTIALPQDHVIVRNFSDNDGTITDGVNIPTGWMGLDIGPRTQKHYAELIEKASVIFWNGPMGVFEREAFSQGTLSVANAIARSSAQSVVGGGDSASAIKDAGLLDQITHVSTGGGASLEFVEGRLLPGIEALRSNHPFDLG